MHCNYMNSDAEFGADDQEGDNASSMLEDVEDLADLGMLQW